MILFALQAPPALRQSPSPQAIQARAEALEKAQQWAALADFFESLGPRDRGLFLTYWLKSLQKAQRWDRMLEVCEAAIPQLEAKSGPKAGLERLLRANALSHLGRHIEALAAHLENGKLGSSSSYRSACSVARLVPDWTSEQACADALLALKPGDAEALAWKGEALAQQKQFKEAEPVLREAIKGAPKQPLAWSNLGRCLNERAAWPEALEMLNQALVLDPALPEAHYNRGRTNFELKRFQQSVEDFRVALASNPNDPELKENLHQAERYLKAQRNGAKSK
ncbi:MAG: tetratricopeptide repeat protein [Acidobacteriota bacterium]|nr:tetratricopeptide repeat protein [Acidobacteriota bacterium]